MRHRTTPLGAARPRRRQGAGDEKEKEREEEGQEGAMRTQASGMDKERGEGGKGKEERKEGREVQAIASLNSAKYHLIYESAENPSWRNPALRDLRAGFSKLTETRGYKTITSRPRGL